MHAVNAPQSIVAGLDPAIYRLCQNAGCAGRARA
jgi:hypothetical protein